MFPLWRVYGLIALLLVAILPLPLGFYALVRVFVTLGFVLFAVVAHKRGDTNLVRGFGAVALVFNPLIPFYLGKELWIIVDLVAAAFLISKVRYLTGPKPWVQNGDTY